MARKNASSKNTSEKSSRLERALFVGYVNVTLTEADREDFEGWLNTEQLALETYLDALDVGYQFTTKREESHDSYAVSISCWDRSKIDAGIIYTGRSDTPDRALWKCVYVWDRKLLRDLSNGFVARGNRDAF